MSAVYLIEVELNDSDLPLAKRIIQALNYGEEPAKFRTVTE